MRISEVYRSLISSYTEWNKFLANPNFIRRNGQVTWSGNRGAYSFGPITEADVIKMADERQYTFQTFDDGSIIQIHYSFNNNKLDSANLAFYYSGTSYKQIEEQLTTNKRIHIDDIEEDENQSEDEITLLNTNNLNFGQPVGWIRLDYAPDQYNGILHAKCHMHLSLFPTTRIVVDGVPNPKQFIEFVFAMCYPQTYKEKRLDENGNLVDRNHLISLNTPCIFLPDDIYECIPHFHIPSNAVPRITVN